MTKKFENRYLVMAYTDNIEEFKLKNEGNQINIGIVSGIAPTDTPEEHLARTEDMLNATKHILFDKICDCIGMKHCKKGKIIE